MLNEFKFTLFPLTMCPTFYLRQKVCRGLSQVFVFAAHHLRPFKCLKMSQITS